MLIKYNHRTQYSIVTISYQNMVVKEEVSVNKVGFGENSIIASNYYLAVYSSEFNIHEILSSSKPSNWRTKKYTTEISLCLLVVSTYNFFYCVKKCTSKKKFYNLICVCKIMAIIDDSPGIIWWNKTCI